METSQRGRFIPVQGKSIDYEPAVEPAVDDVGLRLKVLSARIDSLHVDQRYSRSLIRALERRASALEGTPWDARLLDFASRFRMAVRDLLAWKRCPACAGRAAEVEDVGMFGMAELPCAACSGFGRVSRFRNSKGLSVW